MAGWRRIFCLKQCVCKQAAAGIQIRHTVHFFIVTKVFAHLTHLKLPKISQTYLKFLIWLQQLIQTCLDYYEK
jgi:hypothetical protein